jgi:hypothetical protein
MAWYEYSVPEIRSGDVQSFLVAVREKGASNLRSSFFAVRRSMR